MRRKKLLGRHSKLVAKGLLGNRREGNNKELMRNLKPYKNKRCNMPIFFTHIWTFFPSEMWPDSGELNEKFHQDILTKEMGKWRTAMLADYCWTSARETKGRRVNMA